MKNTIPAKSGIYKILNTVTGKCYVGSAVNLKKRRDEHFNLLRRGAHHSTKLQNSWGKHGEGAFVFEILETVSEKDSLISREQFWIDKLKAFGEGGYNMSPRAGSSLGVKHSEKSRLNMSRAHIGHRHSEETITKFKKRTASAETLAKLIGRKATPETRAKMSAARKGQTVSDETRAKVSYNSSHRSIETRAKIGAGHKGKIVSEETREKLSVAAKGRKHTAEMRAHLSEVMKVRVFTDEHRANLTEAWIVRRANKQLQAVA
ncbi:MAG: NUMOD3 domain-containing DNA-binding protein [Smithella sp.]|jgi:group I intron endonuclease